TSSGAPADFRPAGSTGEARVDNDKTARAARDDGRRAADRDQSTRPALDRRGFLKGAATGAAALAVGGGASAETGAAADGSSTAVAAPTAAQVERDAGNGRPPAPPPRAAVRPGSDLMVQVLKELGIEFVASNPGSSFEGLQESIVNYREPP